MCIICDLTKAGEERDRAIRHIEAIMDTCDRIKLKYRQIRSGDIKPHTKEMIAVVLEEKRLMRIFIDDIL